MLGADKFKKSYLGVIRECSKCGDKNIRYLGFYTWLCGNGHQLDALPVKENGLIINDYLITTTYGVERADEIYGITAPPYYGSAGAESNTIINPPAWDKDGCLCDGQTCDLPSQLQITFNNFLGVAGGGMGVTAYTKFAGADLKFYNSPFVGHFLNGQNLCDSNDGAISNTPGCFSDTLFPFGTPRPEYTHLCTNPDWDDEAYNYCSDNAGPWSINCGCYSASANCLLCNPGTLSSWSFTDNCNFNFEAFWVPTDYNNTTMNQLESDRCGDTYLDPIVDCNNEFDGYHQNYVCAEPDPITGEYIPGGVDGHLRSIGCYDGVSRKRCHQCGTFRCSGEDAKYRIECSHPNKNFTYSISDALDMGKLQAVRALFENNATLFNNNNQTNDLYAYITCLDNSGYGTEGIDWSPNPSSPVAVATINPTCQSDLFELLDMPPCTEKMINFHMSALETAPYNRQIEQPKGLRSVLTGAGDVNIDDINQQNIILDRIPSNPAIWWDSSEIRAKPGVSQQAYIEYPIMPGSGSDVEPELIAVIISESGTGGQIAFQTWPVSFDTDILLDNNFDPNAPNQCPSKTRIKAHGYGVMYPFFDDPIWSKETEYNFPVFLRGKNYKIGDKIEFRAWRAMDGAMDRQQGYELSIASGIPDISPGNHDPAWEETIREVIVATATITEVDSRGGIVWYEFDGDPISGDCPCERDWPGDPGDGDLNIPLQSSCGSISSFCYPEEHAKIDFVNCGFYAGTVPSCEYAEEEVKGPNDCNILYTPIVGSTDCYPNKTIVELSNSGIYRLSSCSTMTEPPVYGYWNGSHDIPPKAAKFKYEWLPNPMCYWNVSEGFATNYLVDRGCSPLFQLYNDNNGNLQLRRKFKDYEISPKAPCRKSDDAQGNTLFVKYDGGDGTISSGVLNKPCCYVVFDDIKDDNVCPSGGVFVGNSEEQCLCCPEGYSGVFPLGDARQGRCCIDCSETSPENDPPSPILLNCEAPCWESLLERPDCELINGRPVCSKLIDNESNEDCESNSDVLNWISELRALCGDYIIGSYTVTPTLCEGDAPISRTNDDYCRVYGFYQQKQSPCVISYEGQYIMRAQAPNGKVFTGDLVYQGIGQCEPVIGTLRIDFVRLEAKIDISVMAPTIQDYLLPELLATPTNGLVSSEWNKGFSQGGFGVWTENMSSYYPEPRSNCEINQRKSFLAINPENCSAPNVVDCDEKCEFNEAGSECVTLPNSCGGFTYCFDCYIEGYRDYFDDFNNREAWRNSFIEYCGYPWESNCSTAQNEEYKEDTAECYIDPDTGELICQSPAGVLGENDFWLSGNGFSIQQEEEKPKCEPFCMVQNTSAVLGVKKIDTCQTSHCFVSTGSYPDKRIIGYPDRYYTLEGDGRTYHYTYLINTANGSRPEYYDWDGWQFNCPKLTKAGDSTPMSTAPIIIKCYKDDSDTEANIANIDAAINNYSLYWQQLYQGEYKWWEALLPSAEYQYDQQWRLFSDYIFKSDPTIRKIDLFWLGVCIAPPISFENCKWSSKDGETYAGSIEEIVILNPGSGYAFEVEERFAPTGIAPIDNIIISGVVSAPLNIRRKEETWGLESYSLSHNGSGNYDPGDTITIKFNDEDARRNGVDYIRYPTLLVESIDESGIITETSILESGEYYVWKGTGQHRAFPISMTINNYWQHPYGLDMTTDLGEGALLRCVVNTDPESSEYGRIVDVVVDAGGRNYVETGKYWYINTYAAPELNINHLVDPCKFEVGVKDPLTIWDMPIVRADPETGMIYNVPMPAEAHYVSSPGDKAGGPIKWRDKVESWNTVLTRDKCPLQLMERTYKMALIENIDMLYADCDADCNEIGSLFDNVGYVEGYCDGTYTNDCLFIDSFGDCYYYSPQSPYIGNPNAVPPQDCCVLEDKNSLRLPECNKRTAFLSQAWKRAPVFGTPLGDGFYRIPGCYQESNRGSNSYRNGSILWPGYQNPADNDIPEYSIVAVWNPNNTQGEPAAYHTIYGFNGQPLTMKIEPLN